MFLLVFSVSGFILLFFVSMLVIAESKTTHGIYIGAMSIIFGITTFTMPKPFNAYEYKASVIESNFIDVDSCNYKITTEQNDTLTIQTRHCKWMPGDSISFTRF